MLIDTHLHLVNEDFDIDKVINNALNHSVKYLIVAGAETGENELNVELSKKYSNVFLTCGFHPDVCERIEHKEFLDLENIIKNEKKVIGIGEIGLDYHYGSTNKEKQIDLFKKQLHLAEKYNLPVVIHSRDAFLDTYNILKEYKLKNVVIHCFSGSLEVAKQYINRGYYLGIGGVVTFKNSNLKDVVKKIGLDNIVLETDSPYLSPFRGKKNEPMNIEYICKYISEVLEIPFEVVAEKTTSNAKKVFNFSEK